MAYDFSVFNENDLNERQKLDEEFVIWLVNEKAYLDYQKPRPAP